MTAAPHLHRGPQALAQCTASPCGVSALEGATRSQCGRHHTVYSHSVDDYSFACVCVCEREMVVVN